MGLLWSLLLFFIIIFLIFQLSVIAVYPRGLRARFLSLSGLLPVVKLRVVGSWLLVCIGRLYLLWQLELRVAGLLFAIRAIVKKLKILRTAHSFCILNFKFYDFAACLV